jgi:hypothetical protein
MRRAPLFLISVEDNKFFSGWSPENGPLFTENQYQARRYSAVEDMEIDLHLLKKSAEEPEILMEENGNLYLVKLFKTWTPYET